MPLLHLRNAYHTSLKLRTDIDRQLRISGVAIRGRHYPKGPESERRVPVKSVRVLKHGAAAHAPSVRVDNCFVPLGRWQRCQSDHSPKLAISNITCFITHRISVIP